ncbi:MAG: hypothetical protein KDB00_25705, partial [Planctomycetales bacterium]|nr:hypothetical protein [Planctomycetales bacterium]
MSGRRRNTGVSVGHDAFLDIVANLVGILIILVVILGAQSHAIIHHVTPEQEPPEDPEMRIAAEEDMNRLAKAAVLAASAQADSIRLERTIKVMDDTIARQSERRTILLALLSEAEAAWKDEQSKLDEASRSAAQRNSEAKELRSKLTDLAGEESQLTDAQPPVVAISHLPTPMAKTVFGKEVYLRLKDDRLSVIPFEQLADEIGRDFRRTSGSLREGVSDAAVGPVRGYVARYVLNRSNELVRDGNSIARMSRARVMVAAFEPLREPHGTPIKEVLENDDWLDVELNGYPPGTTTVTV